MRDSFDMLPFLHPSPLVCEQYKWARAQLPTCGYVSVHVRDTDIKADTKSLIHKHGERLRRISGAIHLATDNPKTIDVLKQSGIKAKCFTTFPPPNARPRKNLHSDSSLSGTCRLHDALVDLMLMSGATSFISNSKGGFTRLASSLQSKRTRFAEGIAWNTKTKPKIRPEERDIAQAYM